MIKLPVFKKECLSYNVGNNFVSELGILFQNINDPLTIYSIKRIELASSQGLPLLGFFPYVILFSQSLINADIFLPVL